MDKLPPIPSPPGTAFREFRVKFVPVAMFALVLAMASYTWTRYVGPVALVGEVQMVRSSVSAPVSGRLSQMPVAMFQRVRAGQVVGQITQTEPAVLDAQVALARARIDQVRISFDPELRRQNNQVGYASLRLNWLDERTQLAAQLARTNFLGGELDRAKRFQAGIGTGGVAVRVTDPLTGFASVADVQKAQAAYDEAVASIHERSKAIAEISEILERLAPEEKRLDDEIPAGIRSAILVEERNLQLLETQLAPQSVLAPIDGVVTAVQRRAGEHVKSGEVLLTITAESGGTILAYFHAPVDESARPGRMLEVRPQGGKRGRARTQITEIGPALESIPNGLLPARPPGASSELGLPMTMVAPPELGLRPGELVNLRFVD